MQKILEERIKFKSPKKAANQDLRRKLDISLENWGNGPKTLRFDSTTSISVKRFSSVRQCRSSQTFIFRRLHSCLRVPTTSTK